MGTITQQFQSMAQAQNGAEHLRAMGIPDSAISLTRQAGSNASSGENAVLVTAMVPEGQESVARAELSRGLTAPEGPGQQRITDRIRAQMEGDVPLESDVAAMAGPGAIGYGAVGGPTGLTARAAAVGSGEELAGKITADDTRGDDVS